MSASDSVIPGGHPSITQPIAGPWLSPHVVTRNRSPKVLKLTAGYSVTAAISGALGFFMPMTW